MKIFHRIRIHAFSPSKVSSGGCSEELLEVFASDLSEQREEKRDGDWLEGKTQRGDRGKSKEKRDGDWQLLEGNQERKTQRGDKGAQSKGKAEREEKKESREGFDTGGSRRARVRVGSAPQTRKFAPTVVEPFGMTVREEERRKAQELALAAVAPKEERKEKTIQEEQFKAIPMPDHIKDETRCVQCQIFSAFPSGSGTDGSWREAKRGKRKQKSWGGRGLPKP